MGKKYNVDELRRQLYEETNKAYQQKKINPDAYKGYTGRDAPERVSQNVREGNGKQPQQTNQVDSPSPEAKEFQSKVFQRLQQEHPGQLEGELPYDRAILKTEFDFLATNIFCETNLF